MNIFFIMAIISLLTAVYAITMGFVLADDTEDKGISLTDKLLERIREWNIQKAYNETLELAEQFEK